ncbi:MAG TPA: hypothetical protein VKB57_23640 [Acidimicrobiales bacterium]|nr:hypothetical protein [Acidimicrobiales bacterium]
MQELADRIEAVRGTATGLASLDATGKIPAAQLPVASVGYGTSLPASPVDGQEHILVDSTTNPTYQWRFRYNAGSSSAYKWEFVGGSPWRAGPVGSVTGFATTGSWVAFAGGPVWTILRNGDWEVEFGITAQMAGAGVSTIQAAIGYTLPTPTMTGAILDHGSSGQWDAGSLAGFAPLIGLLTTNGNVGIYLQGAGGTPNFNMSRGWMTVRPIRVS